MTQQPTCFFNNNNCCDSVFITTHICNGEPVIYCWECFEHKIIDIRYSFQSTIASQAKFVHLRMEVEKLEIEATKHLTKAEKDNIEKSKLTKEEIENIEKLDIIINTWFK